jgi:hypothetical protein
MSHLNGKVAAPVKKTELRTGGIRCADHDISSIRKKLTLTSPTGGGRSVGIVRLRTKGHGVQVHACEDYHRTKFGRSYIEWIQKCIHLRSSCSYHVYIAKT